VLTWPYPTPSSIPELIEKEAISSYLHSTLHCSFLFAIVEIDGDVGKVATASFGQLLDYTYFSLF
jgi:hypothetical protein